MISRRNIRVKVMQTLYSLESQDDTVNEDSATRLLQKHVEQSRELVVFLTYFLTEVVRYAEIDAKNRASKYVPSLTDLQVNTKIAGNELLWKILELPSYVKALKNDKPNLMGDADMTRRTYVQMTQTETYQAYINIQSRDRKEEKAILEFIFNDLMLANESFTAFVEEKFSNWSDDGDMAQALILGLLAKPSSFDFQELITAEKWDFAKKLLVTTLNKKDVVLEYIIPKLKNWEPERIAMLDMLLMRMGVCEFLFFETIPPKVTINEYIDLAKEYSTEQSGHFINGILDNIHKDLLKDQKMHKVSFR